MTNYNISLNDELAEIVENAVEQKMFSSSNDFFIHLIRQQYLKDDEVSIEEVSPYDADYAFVREREENARFVSLKDLIS